MSTHHWLACVIYIHWFMTLSFYVPLFCTVSWVCLSDIILIMNGKGPAVNPLKTISISTLSWFCVFVVTFCSMVDDFDSWSLYYVFVFKGLANFEVRGYHRSSSIVLVLQDLQTHHRCGDSELVAAAHRTGHKTNFRFKSRKCSRGWYKKRGQSGKELMQAWFIKAEFM